MLPARYRMRRSVEFSTTVKRGVRAVQPDLVVHARQDFTDPGGPRVGFVVTTAVGNAVQRHRVSRRLRHAARVVLDQLEAPDRVVIRALPSSRDALSARLEQEILNGVRRTREVLGRQR